MYTGIITQIRFFIEIFNKKVTHVHYYFIVTTLRVLTSKNECDGGLTSVRWVRPSFHSKL